MYPSIRSIPHSCIRYDSSDTCMLVRAVESDPGCEVKTAASRLLKRAAVAVPPTKLCKFALHNAKCCQKSHSQIRLLLI